MNARLTVLRFDPLRDREPAKQEYFYRLEPGMSLLNCLDQIYREQDSTLRYSYCCKAGVCGMCGVMADGKPSLLCHAIAKDDVLLEPLRGFPVIRDLVIDRDACEDWRQGLQLYPKRLAAAGVLPETITAKNMALYKTPSRCIECYCCMSSCPVYLREPHGFAGPCLFTLLARHYVDPRDEDGRLTTARAMGVNKCKECGKCSGVCHVQASPAEQIKRFKRELQLQHKMI